MRELTHTDRHWLTTDRQTIILIDWTDKFDFDFEVRGLRWEGGGCYEVQVVKLSLQYEGRAASGHLQVTASGKASGVIKLFYFSVSWCFTTPLAIKQLGLPWI